MYRFVDVSMQKMEDCARLLLLSSQFWLRSSEHLEVHAEGDNNFPSIALHGTEYIEAAYSSARHRRPST